jgi:hypothetical protein
MEATRSSEMSIYNKPTRRHIPEDGIGPGVHSACNRNEYQKQENDVSGEQSAAGA